MDDDLSNDQDESDQDEQWNNERGLGKWGEFGDGWNAERKREEGNLIVSRYRVCSRPAVRRHRETNEREFVSRHREYTAKRGGN